MSCTKTGSECWISLSVAVLLLSGCGAKPERPKASFNTIPVAVATSCVDPKGRPAVPPTLKQRYTAEQWASLPPGAKAQAVAAQAGARLNYEDEDRAATAGCR